jgi:hypothetical protein
MKAFKEDAALQERAIMVVAGVLLILGSIVVLLMTGRPSLLILVFLICSVGAALAFIGSRPSA